MRASAIGLAVFLSIVVLFSGSQAQITQPVDVYTNKGGRGPNADGGSFEIGEKIEIIGYFNIAAGCQAKLTITKPDGTKQTSGPGPVEGIGAWKLWTAIAAEPPGRRTVLLEVWCGQFYSSDTTWYTVTEPLTTTQPPQEWSATIEGYYSDVTRLADGSLERFEVTYFGPFSFTVIGDRLSGVGTIRKSYTITGWSCSPIRNTLEGSFIVTGSVSSGNTVTFTFNAHEEPPTFHSCGNTTDKVYAATEGFHDLKVTMRLIPRAVSDYVYHLRHLALPLNDQIRVRLGEPGVKTAPPPPPPPPSTTSNPPPPPPPPPNLPPLITIIVFLIPAIYLIWRWWPGKKDEREKCSDIIVDARHGSPAGIYINAPGEFGAYRAFPAVEESCCPCYAIFVHGYNVNHEEALETFGKLNIGLKASGYEGSMVLFSWSGDFGVLNFELAEHSANAHSWALANLIRDLNIKCPDRHVRIDMITHSLGARVALKALHRGARVSTLTMIAPAVNDYVLGPKGDFPGTFKQAEFVQVLYSREDLVLRDGYPLMKDWKSALGYRGARNKALPNYREFDCSGFAHGHSRYFDEGIGQTVKLLLPKMGCWTPASGARKSRPV